MIHGPPANSAVSNVYDLDGKCTQIAIGALLENIAIAASNLGYRLDVSKALKASDGHLEIAVQFIEDLE